MAKVFLIVGPTEADKAYAEAVRNSARKFGLKITAEKPWTFGPLAKARGDTPTRAEAMVFTRGLDYDMALVADEEGDWGDYVSYRTVDPRPVGGTQALTSTTWSPVLETWGAAQAQNRFRRLASRLMRPLDYQAWAAIRTVGEAVTAKKTNDPAVLTPYLVDPAFNLPAYKGVSLSFRPWDHQLRQPVIVVQPKALVSVAPEQGFLHQRTLLDTLGVDCRRPPASSNDRVLAGRRAVPSRGTGMSPPPLTRAAQGGHLPEARSTETVSSRSPRLTMSHEVQEARPIMETRSPGISVNDAIDRAKEWLLSTMSTENVSNLGLEEVEHHPGYWNITLGFSRPWDEARNAISVLSGTVVMRRTYKIVTVDETTGEIVSMKSRDVE